MQITRAGEYGVLGLLALARRGSTVMIEEISREEKIPKSFLAKIFQVLAKAGLVRSIRGAGGGFELVKRPAQVTVLEVIEAIEGKIAFQRCLQEEGCEHVGGCALCGLFEQAQDQLKEVLMRTTLEDLLAKSPVNGAIHPLSASCDPGRRPKPQRSILRAHDVPAP
jgi:Rrf2 family transcriptional regulator, iron-sulfur cluster assembly transcription factor